ncbi:MFS transporter [Rhodocytophaga aerolata]|uniref:MFS transporter n=2 Tax=Rhodocytophaga aerolata TaxID=455078 RepID=A0ABT8QYR2_9BACT|nr:MFS transporter [Rhodocytophaga aerolata]
MLSKLSIFPSPRRVIRLTIGTFFFLQGLCFSSWASRIPTIGHQLGLSHGKLGAVLFALPIGLITSLPLSGWLISRYGSRQVLIVSAILYASFLPLIGLTAEAWQLMAMLFLLGLSGNVSNIAMNTQAVHVEAWYGRSIMASLHGLNSLAGFAGAAIGMYCVSLHLSPFVHFSLICALAYMSIAFLYRYVLPFKEKVKPAKPTFSFALPEGRLTLLGLIVFCGMVCEGTLFDWSGIYFMEVVKAPVDLTSVGYLAFMYAMAFGRFVGDWLSSRFGTKQVIRVNGLLIGIGLTTAIVLPYVSTATVGFLLAGAGVSTIVPLIYGSIGKQTNGTASNALAAVASMGYIGFLLGPPIIGMLAEIINLQWAFAFVALLGMLAAVLISKVKFE